MRNVKRFGARRGRIHFCIVRSRTGQDGGVEGAGFQGQRSGLRAAPLAVHGPPQKLLHVPRHVHGVVQVELSLAVQHGVTPKGAGQHNREATAHNVVP